MRLGIYIFFFLMAMDVGRRPMLYRDRAPHLNYFILIRYFFFASRRASPVALWRPPGEARLTY